MEDLKVHVVQGATEAMWVMTSEYAQSEQPDVELEGQYGGRFEEADRRYARFLKASKQDKSLMQRLNGLNAGKHLYDPMSGPFSVSTELVSMESWTRAGEVDPVVTGELLARSAADRKCAVLLNAGYAFGSASWPMGLALRDSFGAALKSFHVIGKAGGLAGGVGDYQVPSSFFLWDRVGAPASVAPEVYRIDVSKVDLSLWSGKQPQVYSGGLMTVPSVVLQSHHLLDAAKLPPWGAVGIEMESLWFKRALPDTPGLYLYYTSDIPQAADSSLAHESYPWAEGQTLFNGLTRMVLVDILSGASTRVPALGVVALVGLALMAHGPERR
uniref:Uncharacterized protein n=1 Tax=Alexandrium andersonii TaxID=327968 RepID=A0A7S2AZX5_9DINO